MTTEAQRLESFLSEHLGQRLFGLQEVSHALVVALIGKGHVLLEGPPGLGKTFLSRTFAGSIGGKFQRIQGTADLMPSDITGVHVFDSGSSSFVFHQGPLFADIVLFDEINRAGPKTQSALLEAMEERQVTVDRDSFPLPPDFMVVATQNPREFEGTYPLPESQLDRFMLSVRVDYPERDDEARILREYGLPAARGDAFEPLPPGVLEAARSELAAVHVSDELVGYVLDLAAASRRSPNVTLGMSSRAALALLHSARIEALLRNGEHVLPDDVQRVAPWVMNHRISMSPESVLEGLTAAAEVDRLLDAVNVPR